MIKALATSGKGCTDPKCKRCWCLLPDVEFILESVPRNHPR